MKFSKAWLFAFPMLLMGALFSFTHERDWALPENLEQTHGMVISSGCEQTIRSTPKGSFTYFLYKISFSYSVAGSSYISNRYSQYHGYGSSLASCKSEIGKLAAGVTLPVWYDPKSPSYAIYQKAAPKNFLGQFCFSVGILFLCIAVYRSFFSSLKN